MNESYDENIRLFDIFLEVISEGLSEPEQILYHYTTPQGLNGIIESKSIWASHYRFTNDNTELTYIFDILPEVLRDLQGNEIIDEFMNRVDRWTFTGNRRFYREVYIASFSETPDLLSQWRGYGSMGNGSCIGIDFQRVRNIRKGIPNHSVWDANTSYLLKVEYDQEIQKRKLNAYFIKICEEYSDASSFPYEELFQLMIINSFLMKHNSFKEENECRLIYMTVSGYDRSLYPVCFRFDNNDNNIPYVKIPLVDNGDFIPFEKIIIGPKRYKTIYREGLGALLNSKGYHDVDSIIEKSNIPLFTTVRLKFLKTRPVESAFV